MQISKALALSKTQLAEVGISSSSLDATILLAFILNSNKEFVIFNGEKELNSEQEISFFNLIDKRKKFEPISHLIQKREFYGLDFFVNSDVLDPRPDSENLIELILEYQQNQNSSLNILELGVGSGCLSITLLKNLTNSVGTAVDISEKALEIALRNAKTHEVDNKLQLLKSDLFANISPENLFDIIVSNPPYIPSKDISCLQQEVKIYEPHLALDGGIEGLDFYKRIAELSKNFLKKDGKIFLEIGYGQKEDIEEIFNKNGFELTNVKKDLSNIDRALCFSPKIFLN